MLIQNGQELRASLRPRWEILGLESDPSRVQELPKEVSRADPEATRRQQVIGKRVSKGGILSALLRSPLVGSELNLERDRRPGRQIDL
jgi:hypothetical protein